MYGNKKAYNKGVKTASFLMGYADQRAKEKEKQRRQEQRTIGDNNLNTGSYTDHEKKSRGYWD